MQEKFKNGRLNKSILTSGGNTLHLESTDSETEMKFTADFSHLVKCDEVVCEVSFTGSYASKEKLQNSLDQLDAVKAQGMYDLLRKEFEQVNQSILKPLNTEENATK